MQRSYLDEDEEGAELGRDVEHESRVGGEPLDVALVAGVHEQRPGAVAVAGAGPPPEGVVEEVLLAEDHGRVGREGEVVQLLREVVNREGLLRRGAVGRAIGGRGDEELAAGPDAAACPLVALQSLQVQRSDGSRESSSWLLGGGGRPRCCCGWCCREGRQE